MLGMFSAKHRAFVDRIKLSHLALVVAAAFAAEAVLYVFLKNAVLSFAVLALSYLIFILLLRIKKQKARKASQSSNAFQRDNVFSASAYSIHVYELSR